MTTTIDLSVRVHTEVQGTNPQDVERTAKQIGATDCYCKSDIKARLFFTGYFPTIKQAQAIVEYIEERNHNESLRAYRHGH